MVPIRHHSLAVPARDHQQEIGTVAAPISVTGSATVPVGPGEEYFRIGRILAVATGERLNVHMCGYYGAAEGRWAILAGLATFERHLIKARTEDGRKRAKERGGRFGRPPRSVHSNSLSLRPLLQKHT
jgi:hypothetical protein